MKRILALLLAGLGVWFYFTPHLAVRGMQAAVEARDVARLASYVDFPALRENLKSVLSDRLRAELKTKALSNSNDIAAGLGAALVSAFLNPMIDKIVTPEGISHIMAGQALASPRSQRPNPDTTTQPPSSAGQSAQSHELSMTYESFNRFVARSKRSDATNASGALVFARDGWFSWKLTGIRLPD